MVVLLFEGDADSSLKERTAGLASLSALAALGTTSESVGMLVARALVVAVFEVS